MNVIALIVGASAYAADAYATQTVNRISEAGWISIVTLIMSGLGAMFAAWIGMKQASMRTQLNETKDTVEETKGEIAKTKEMVNGQMSEFKAMMRELMAEKVITARTEGKEEEQETGMAQLQEKADAAQQVRNTAIITAQALKLAAALTSPPPAPAAPTMVLEAEPQHVELHVSGTGTFKDAEEVAHEKELAEKHGEEEKKK